LDIMTPSGTPLEPLSYALTSLAARSGLFSGMNEDNESKRSVYLYVVLSEKHAGSAPHRQIRAIFAGIRMDPNGTDSRLEFSPGSLDCRFIARWQGSLRGHTGSISRRYTEADSKGVADLHHEVLSTTGAVQAATSNGASCVRSAAQKSY